MLVCIFHQGDRLEACNDWLFKHVPITCIEYVIEPCEQPQTCRLKLVAISEGEEGVHNEGKGLVEPLEHLRLAYQLAVLPISVKGVRFNPGGLKPVTSLADENFHDLSDALGQFFIRALISIKIFFFLASSLCLPSNYLCTNLNHPFGDSLCPDAISYLK